TYLYTLSLHDALPIFSSYWDAFGNRNGKNTYLYKPERSGWKLFCWDFDVGLGVFADPIDNPLFDANDPVVTRMVPQTAAWTRLRSEEHTSELQSRSDL